MLGSYVQPSITGATVAGLVLKLTASDGTSETSPALAANAANYKFGALVSQPANAGAAPTTYSVSVVTQPPGLVCTVAPTTGNITAQSPETVTEPVVTCKPQANPSGTVAAVPVDSVWMLSALSLLIGGLGWGQRRRARRD